MALFQSKYVAGGLRVPAPQWAGAPAVVRFDHALSVAPALNDIIELGVLPQYCSVVDMILVPDDLDSNGTPLLALDVGIMSGTVGDPDAGRTVGNEFFAADQSARTGIVARMTKPAGFRVVPTAADRSIGVKIQQAAATFQAGTISVLVVLATNPAG
jgi:hypothetical protein